MQKIEQSQSFTPVQCYRQYVIGEEFPFPALRRYQVVIDQQYYNKARDKLKFLNPPKSTESLQLKIKSKVTKLS